jgi:hypothetical protein
MKVEGFKGLVFTALGVTSTASQLVCCEVAFWAPQTSSSRRGSAAATTHQWARLVNLAAG